LSAPLFRPALRVLFRSARRRLCGFPVRLLRLHLGYSARLPFSLSVRLFRLALRVLFRREPWLLFGFPARLLRLPLCLGYSARFRLRSQARLVGLALNSQVRCTVPLFVLAARLCSAISVLLGAGTVVVLATAARHAYRDGDDGRREHKANPGEEDEHLHAEKLYSFRRL
jgi:hypothetical protein